MNFPFMSTADLAVAIVIRENVKFTEIVGALNCSSAVADHYSLRNNRTFKL